MDAALLRLGDGLIHRPVSTVLMLAASLWATVELARWTERRERKRQAAERRRATMQQKKFDAFWKRQLRRRAHGQP
jgi:hypothetical protein